jgi:hypothetical protein
VTTLYELKYVPYNQANVQIIGISGGAQALLLPVDKQIKMNIGVQTSLSKNPNYT